MGMEIGDVYPKIEPGVDPAAVRRIGNAVGDLGFDYVPADASVAGAVHTRR